MVLRSFIALFESNFVFSFNVDDVRIYLFVILLETPDHELLSIRVIISYRVFSV